MRENRVTIRCMLLIGERANNAAERRKRFIYMFCFLENARFLFERKQAK